MGGLFTNQLLLSLYLNGYFGNKDVASLKWGEATIYRGGGGRRWTGEGGDGILEGKSCGWWPMMAAHLGELVASLLLSGSLSMFRMWKLLLGPTLDSCSTDLGAYDHQGRGSLSGCLIKGELVRSRWDRVVWSCFWISVSIICCNIFWLMLQSAMAR